MQAQSRFFILILITSALISGCSLFRSPEKKLEKLLKNYPQLTERDTISQLDTVIIPGIDTVIRIPVKIGSDTTIQIHQYRATVTQDPTEIKIDLHIPPDTAVNRSTVIREVVGGDPAEKINWERILFGLVGLSMIWITVIAVVFYLFRQRS